MSKMSRLTASLGMLIILFGVVIYNIKERNIFLGSPSNLEIEQNLRSLAATQRPFVEINFSALFGAPGQLQVLHPMLDMQRLQIKMPEPICESTGTSFGASTELVTIKDRSKQILYDQFYRTEITSLPADFVTTPPFIGPFGSSYAGILSGLGLAPYNEKTWVQDHLSFFKAEELKGVLSKFKIQSPEFETIADLNSAEIEEIVKGSPLVLTNMFLFVKNDSRFGFSPLSYFAYNIHEFRRELAKGRLDLIPYSTDSLCLVKSGNACWTYNSKHILSYLYRYSIVFFAVAAVLVMFLFGLYAKYLREKSQERKKHRLALQVLSHEFRTPVAAMMLLIEQISSDAKYFQPKHQDNFTRLSSEIYKLQRIIEVCKTYLQAEGHRIPFAFAEIPSVNDWIQDYVLESGLEIRVVLLEKDQSVTADIFWLKFVLTSLVQNAFSHGKPPVTLRLIPKETGLDISVEDQGTCEFDSISEMSNPFIKSRKSQGMGLGLNISKFIVDEWGQELKFSQSPTAFKIAFPDRNT